MLTFLGACRLLHLALVVPHLEWYEAWDFCEATQRLLLARSCGIVRLEGDDALVLEDLIASEILDVRDLGLLH
jgi:hypothetical protein